MHPDRVTRIFAIIGIYLLLGVLVLRVLSLVTISWQNHLGLTDSPVRPIIPSLGHYTLSANGKQVSFERQIDANGDIGWFSMPLEGGPVSPATLPDTTLDPFLVRDNQLFLLGSDGYSLINGSPRDTQVASYARSPDGNTLAFAAHRPGGTWGLYILNDTGKLDWLGDHDQIDDLAWSPDNQNLAFIAQSQGSTQVFIIRRDGQNQRQATNDPSQKSLLRWSPDGHMLAYIAAVGGVNLASTPTAPLPHGPYQPPEIASPITISSINIIDAAGASKRIFLQDSLDKYDLSWGVEEAGPVIVYALALPENPKATYLYALDPRNGLSRRVYPPLEIASLDCPKSISAGGSGSIRITIANSGLRPVDASLILRARSQRFPTASKLDTNIIRSEVVQVPPGAQQSMDWPFAAMPGISTHLSVIINPDAGFPMDEKRCTMRNTAFTGLSNLPFLSFILPLSLAGLLLCVPWLRKQKKPILWGLYLAFPLLIVIITFIEHWMVSTRFS